MDIPDAMDDLAKLSIDISSIRIQNSFAMTTARQVLLEYKAYI